MICLPKFRKKPVVIEAFRIGIDPRPDWFQDKVTSNEIVTYTAVANPENLRSGIRDQEGVWCDIQTLEGVMRGNHGDYIIQGVNGEVYPCKLGIFEKTYEEVAE
ncbi:hypothetical protein PWYN_12400 [Paenibacillus wynnii]|uniref:Phage protein n=1 Tax=Paenibacillus wynnii TaxID=268407 RepID=A0A098MBW4_9BACL|nr:hypothetical protein PWYN_12400 [Paenibacillus wynnii]